MEVSSVVTHGYVTPWWVSALSIFQLLVGVVVLFLVVYASWKFFRFLRKWNP